MTDLNLSAAECLGRVWEILQTSRRQALQTVNSAMVEANWQIGREIVEEEQRGQDRAIYGTHLIDVLAAYLSQEYGKGFSARNLWYMKDVYLAFPILNALRSESSELLTDVTKCFLNPPRNYVPTLPKREGLQEVDKVSAELLEGLLQEDKTQQILSRSPSRFGRVGT